MSKRKNKKECKKGNHIFEKITLYDPTISNFITYTKCKYCGYIIKRDSWKDNR